MKILFLKLIDPIINRKKKLKQILVWVYKNKKPTSYGQDVTKIK